MYDFTIIVLQGAFASSVAVTRDILATAQMLAPRVNVAPPRWRICSVDGGLVPLNGGLTIETTKMPRRSVEDRSVWVVPGLGLNTPEAVMQRFSAEDIGRVAKALQKHAAQGGRVAASCSGVFLLQAAELLEERKVTTTWWLAPYLQGLIPHGRVDADRMICSDGQVTTAGSALAQVDLMLFLIRERFGSSLSDLVSRMMLINGRQSQSPFIIPEVMAGGDDLVARITAKVESAMPCTPTISELASAFCMSERTLARHIHKATGKTPLALIQSVRLRRARMLLETSRLTVEQVAEAVGYRDATALRKLMKKAMGTNPSWYRPHEGVS